ncbi:MAG TPA: glycosyltransferase family 2 protein, partial [Candidatus Dormibacteraeota bacterium]|nr:glycosyltransferase family 2 protein [Candidatus Dormibacteraeota bacterium]
LVSIVTLSWNAPEYTKLALESIRLRTREPYEVIVVDNGSKDETLRYLQSIDDPHVRIIYNDTNRGFSAGNNIGIAAASGEFVVILNNDVIVSEDWLDALLDPFARIPVLGISAPRSNNISGHQQIPNVRYDDENELIAFARERARRYRRRGYFTDRAVGFCLCIPRFLIDEIGGFDERFGVGNFEDDDLCMRTRAAGYKIFICDDAFVHHFGSRSFVANNVDYSATMHDNWKRFAQKWGYPSAYPEQGYDPRPGYFRGFDRASDFAALPERAQGSKATLKSESQPRLSFVAELADEVGWEPVGRFLRRYLRAFRAADAVTLSIRLAAGVDTTQVERRIERALESLSIAADDCADVEVVDAQDAAPDEEPSSREIAVRELQEMSPSALRRLLEKSAP